MKRNRDVDENVNNSKEDKYLELHGRNLNDDEVH